MKTLKRVFMKRFSYITSILYVDSLEQARLMVAGNRGYLPIDVLGEMMTPIQGIKRVPLYKMETHSKKLLCLLA